MLDYNVSAYSEYEKAQKYYDYLQSQYDYYKILAEESLELWSKDHSLSNQLDYDYAVFMRNHFKSAKESYYYDTLKYMRRDTMFSLCVEEVVKKIVGRKKYEEYLKKYANR